jgi:hypothetical protein
MPDNRSAGWFPILVSVIPYIRQGDQYPPYSQVDMAARANTSIELHIDMTYDEVKAKIYEVLVPGEPVTDFLMFYSKCKTLALQGREIAVRVCEINVPNCRSMLLGLKSRAFGNVMIEVQSYPDEPEMLGMALDPNLEPWETQRDRSGTEYYRRNSRGTQDLQPTEDYYDHVEDQPSESSPEPSQGHSWEIRDLQRIVDHYEHLEQPSESSPEQSTEHSGSTELPWVEMDEASNSGGSSYAYEEEDDSDDEHSSENSKMAEDSENTEDSKMAEN